MANFPPFINSVGLVPKIFDKLILAQQPSRFTTDFLGTKLGYGSGSARPFIGLLKRIGLLRSDGSPTDLYAKVRNPNERGSAMAQALRIGYPEVFERTEYAYELGREKITNLIVEITGLEKNSSTVPAIVGTFIALNNMADFSAKGEQGSNISNESYVQPASIGVHDYIKPEVQPRFSSSIEENGAKLSMALSYTINLNLPESTNPEVFNAIFKALREHSLRKQ